MVLGTLGIDIAPLLAGAGVLALAVSLGAQTLVKDSIGGLLILVENQYSIGDSIQVGAVSGEVERITLRATYLRAGNGDQYIVPNGEVRVVANQTKTWSMALVCNGIGSRKWRTKKTLPKAVQPWEPCSMGMARRKPRKAKAAPMVELALSGFTDSAFFRFMISAISDLPAGSMAGIFSKAP